MPDLGGGARLADLLALTKPRITLMVMISGGAGYVIGSGAELDPLAFLVAVAGIGLVCGGTSALNQVVERDVDELMERTRTRPLPAGRLTPRVGALFGVVVSLAGVLLLDVLVNRLTAVLAAVALLSYVLVYTPLKRVSPLSTLAGAVPGALPVMGGWAAARGELGAGAWALFGILFFWQLPHFLALAWLYRDDYRRAGLRMLGVGDRGGYQTRRQSVLYALALVPTSLLPVLLKIAGPWYALAALALSLAYLGSALAFAFQPGSRAARGMFRVSLLYLPLLLGLMTADRGRAPSPGETTVQVSHSVVREVVP